MSSLSDLHNQSAKLRVFLNDLIQSEKPVAKKSGAAEKVDSEFAMGKDFQARELDLMVTHVEVNDLHGTGILIKRMFPDWRRFIHTWTCKAYDLNDFGLVHLFVSGWGADRYEMYLKGMEALRTYNIRRICCVPFGVEDLYLAMATKDFRAIPMMIYIMDDQNLTSERIPDGVLREAFQKSDIVFAISPEMRDAYESKYGLKCYILPPLVREKDLMVEPVLPHQVEFGQTGILLGNIWNAGWLEEIRKVVGESGVKIHWYGNAGKFVKFDPQELADDGIIYKGSLPEREICSEIRKYAFGVLPSSPDNQEDWLAKYSIPTRLVTSVAAGNLPMIVIGSERSASSQFVRSLEVGVVCPYDPGQFRSAVEDVVCPERQAHFRANASRKAGLFSDEGIAEWLWASMEKGEPADDRFESAFGRDRNSITAWVEPDAPAGIHHSLRESYFACRRLARLGYKPDFLIDVGASNGVFSDMAASIFPEARMILIEPLASLHRKRTSWFFDRHPEFEIVEAAVGERPGTATFHVSEDLFTSSLLPLPVNAGTKPIEVEVRTLDSLAGELGISGRGLLKIDVQCAEYEVLAGAAEWLKQIDGVMLELSLIRLAPEAKIFDEMLDLLEGLGFRYFDECGDWRTPQDGRLLKKDVLFLRKGLFEFQP